jgi:aryl-alcohol dehydrogenase-like predicted oxidoreductase
MLEAVQLGRNSGLRVSRLCLGTMNFGEPGRGHQGGFGGGSTRRSKGADRQRTESLYRGEMDFQIAERVVEVAGRYGNTPAQIAIAWLLSKSAVTSPIVGVSGIEQLDQLVAATEIRLEPADITYLEEFYRPVENLLSLGFS